MSSPLQSVASIKVKLGLLVVASVIVAVLLTMVGSSSGVSPLLVLPVSVLLALGITQLLAAGMVSPLRQMTRVAQQMARGDYSGRVLTQATDEVGTLAAAFNQMAADLATVDAERRDLIATVSHELRTPLTAMSALLENLADGVVPADVEHLNEALDQATRLQRLVRDLLDFSRAEAGIAGLDRDSFRLRDLVERAVRDVRADGREATYTLTIPDDLTVLGDSARICQLLTNVLDNAGRHAPSGTEVLVTAGADEDVWWVHIADRGVGVAPADRERVFERFGTQSAGGGTGLGLAISRWVAQLHGGTLRFIDPPDHTGAVVRLEIPHAALTPASIAQMTAHSTAPEERNVSSAPVTTGAPVPQSLGPDGSPTALDDLFGRFWPEPGEPSGLRTVLACAAAGVFTGFALSFTGPGITWTAALVGCGAAALLTARRRRTAWTWLCAGLALLLVLPLTLLGAEWIGMLGMITAAAIFLCGVTGAQTFTGVVLTGLAWPLASLRGLPWFGRSLRVAGRPGGAGRNAALVRTAAWSLLGLTVFGGIFASADALFARWVDGIVPNLSFDEVIGRGFLACAAFAVTLAAAYLALNPARVDALEGRAAPPLTNRFEWLVPVLVVDFVFIMFLTAQASAVFGGHAYVERTTGLTYADYVHQGFGQLTLATVLTLLVIAVASRRARRAPADVRWLRLSLGVLGVLTLVVIWSALYRMHVYQQAYGFTRLRLFVDVFEGWLGFVVLTVLVLGATGWGRWVPRVALVSASVALLGLAAINPDAWVASRNIDRYESTGRLDLNYLAGLSADAAPVIVERLPEEIAACALQVSTFNTLRPEVLDDPWAWNLGRERAGAAIAQLTFPASEDWTACNEVWARFDVQ